MVDPERVKEENLTVDELTEQCFVSPADDGTTEAILPEAREDDPDYRLTGTHGNRTLHIDYREFTIRITNEGFTEWRVQFDVPDEVAKWLYGPGGIEHHVKAAFSIGIGDTPEGYIDTVQRDDEATRGEDGENVPPTTIVAYTATNYQPTVAAQSLVDDMWEYAEESERGKEEIEEAFQAASSE